MDAITKPKIFLLCSGTGGGSGRVRGSSFGGDVIGYALAEDGVVLANHLSSSEDFSKHDMGLTSDWKHEKYDAYYPEGYELIWVDDPQNHEEYRVALAKNKAAAAQNAAHDLRDAE